MSMSRFAALLDTSDEIEATITLVRILFGASTAYVSCVSLPSAPAGVIDVSPVALTEMSEKTNTIGTARSPSQSWIPNHSFPTTTRTSDAIGTPTIESQIG